MSDIAILKEMIKENATVPLENHHDKRKVILTELTPPNYSVTMYGMPNDDEVIVIKADNFDSPKKVFKGNRGECKRADFVIIADTENKKVILCIEMKGGKGGSETEIIQQLKGAECFVAYCQKIGQSFWGQPNFLNDYECRFISIKNITRKQKTRIDPNQDFSSNIKLPKNITLLKKSGSSFQFNDLAQGRR